MSSASKEFVVTADNLPAVYVMRLLLANRSNILLMGPTGAVSPGNGSLAQWVASAPGCLEWPPSGT